MKYKKIYGAVLYRHINGFYEYILVKDGNGNCFLPKGNIKDDFLFINGILKETWESIIPLFVVPDEYFKYSFSFQTAPTVKEIHTYTMADIDDETLFLGKGKIEGFVYLRYEEAYQRLCDDRLKDILKEVNDRLVNEMKICCMFKEGAKFDKRNLQNIKYYGDSCNGHELYTWDEGDRTLFRCKECGGYVLEQYSEIHMPDAVYTDYFPVRDEAHAQEINEKYDGWAIERHYPYKKIFFTRHDD